MTKSPPNFPTMTMAEEVAFWDNCDITDYVDLSNIERFKIELTSTDNSSITKNAKISTKM